MKFFSKNEINTSRQFEFDLAKAVCILGMVIIHCFEEFPLIESGYGGALYYTFVTVLDAIFGAGTFMICLGIGLTYTKKNTPNDFIRRGIITFLLGYVLNIFRFVIPYSISFIDGEVVDVLKYLVTCLLYTDIMQFAGLAFLLFGLLKKFKVPDWGIGILAIAMSIIGSFARFIEISNIHIGELLGVFIGVKSFNPYYFESAYYAPFALLNWFVFVIFGYFFGKTIRRVEKIEKFYAISTIISGIVVIAYMLVAIPNQIGMMGDVNYYYQMTTLEAIIIMMGAVFAFGLYHYISKLFNQKTKDFITGLSSNINKTYCIHWVIVGFTEILLWALFGDGLETYVVIIIALIIYVISSLLAEIVKKSQVKKKAQKYATEHKN